MRIATTYENGNIFQHFGRTETFKVYDIVDGAIASSQVVGSNGAGHEALAGVLAEMGVDVLICGGMGLGAQAALAAEGIEVYTGAEGDTDAAVASFLAGTLESEGVNCDHHHEEEEEGCGCGCGGSCGDDEEGCGCGGGCGGCGGSYQPPFEGVNVGKTMRVHYTGTFNDGTKFDSSYDRSEPLEFVCGAGMMILGFDAACANMQVGETANIHLMPEEAYGPSNPNMIFTIPIAQLPGSEELSVGDHVYLTNTMGQPFPVVVTAKDEENITFDANHEMAGKELNFQIEIVSIED